MCAVGGHGEIDEDMKSERPGAQRDIKGLFLCLQGNAGEQRWSIMFLFLSLAGVQTERYHSISESFQPAVM